MPFWRQQKRNAEAHDKPRTRPTSARQRTHELTPHHPSMRRGVLFYYVIILLIYHSIYFNILLFYYFICCRHINTATRHIPTRQLSEVKVGELREVKVGELRSFLSFYVPRWEATAAPHASLTSSVGGGRRGMAPFAQHCILWCIDGCRLVQFGWTMRLW